MTTHAKQRGNDIGPSGLEVARNIKRIRTLWGLTQLALSEKLADMGRPIPVASIGKIESGARRVEIDDLMAISLALGVSPLTLLLPHTRSNDDMARVTGTPGEVFADQIWAWGASVLPIEGATDYLSWKRFTNRSLPWWISRVEITPNEMSSGLRKIFERNYDEQEATTLGEQKQEDA